MSVGVALSLKLNLIFACIFAVCQMPLRIVMNDGAPGLNVLPVLLGVVLGGTASLLFCAKDRLRPRFCQRARRAFVTMLLVGVISASVGVALWIFLPGGFLRGDDMGTTICVSAGGVCIGAGLVTLCALWLDQLMPLSKRWLVVLTVGCLICLSVLDIVAFFLSTTALLLFMGLCILASSCCLAYITWLTPSAWDHLPKPEYQTGEMATTSVVDRVLMLVRLSWRSLLAVLVSMYLCGFTLDPSQSGMAVSSGVPLLIQEVAGTLIAGLLLCVMARFGQVDLLAARFQRVVIPIAVVTFVVTPYFSVDAFGVHYFEFVGVVRVCATCLFFLGLVLSLPVIVRVADASTFFVIGFMMTTMVVAMLMGVFSALAFGSAFIPTSAFLFVAYLALVAISHVSAESERKHFRQIEHDVFEEYLRQRCLSIAHQYGLSPRELDILRYLGRGHGYTHIAEAAFLSESTVRTHAKSIFRKTHVSSREELLDLIDHG